MLCVALRIQLQNGVSFSMLTARFFGLHLRFRTIEANTEPYGFFFSVIIPYRPSHSSMS